MLKKSPNAIFEAMQLIFNTSIRTSLFPSSWKHAIVVPIYKKKGDAFDPASYRPISLLPVMSKIFERLVNCQLRAFLLTHNIIDTAQHGFRTARSCETALLQLTKRLFNLRATKMYVYITALDFSRAFDTVNLDILCNRISVFADSRTTAWFRSYVSERQQSTKYNNVLSEPLRLQPVCHKAAYLALRYSACTLTAC